MIDEAARIEPGMTESTSKSDAPSERRRLSRPEIRQLVRLTYGHGWAVPPLIVLGVATSFAESLGITLVVAFLYAAIGGGIQMPGIAGPLDGLFRTARTTLGPNGGFPLLIFVMVLAKAALGFCYSSIAASVRSGLSETVRNRLHRQCLEMSYQEVRRYDQGELLNVLATTSWSVAEAYLSFTRVLISLCSIVVFMTFLLALSWQITAIAFTGSVLLFAAFRVLSNRAARLGERINQFNRGMAARVLVLLQGMRTIRAFGQERHYQQEFEMASAKAAKFGLMLERLYAAIYPVTEIAYFGLLAAITIFADRRGIPFATALACVALLYRLQPHVREFEANLMRLTELGPPLRPVLALIRTDDKHYPKSGMQPFSRLEQGITFDNVAFTHSGASFPALNGISFSIPTRAVTTIIGESGAGKTTIINLILRLYEPDAGTILVDGHALSSIDREAWLTRVALAGQDVELIEGTIEQNIRMSRPQSDISAIRNAARLAGILDFIEGLPNGFSSWIGQQGLNLSGGQRQRIGIARAILGQPEILIFDEATNALNAELDETIRSNLAHEFAGRTLIVITHRTETVMASDQVIELKRGRIIHSGQPRQSDIHLVSGSPALLAE
ncbi:MAG: ABC transporter ATP-binding protein [Janthinobacterium lividum]